MARNGSCCKHGRTSEIHSYYCRVSPPIFEVDTTHIIIGKPIITQVFVDDQEDD